MSAPELGTEPQPWHRAHLVLPTGLVPKDYRSLKTQYLQVRGWRVTDEQELYQKGVPLLLGMGPASTGPS